MIAAIDGRKSTPQKSVSGTSESVERQIEHARAYAERKGWTVAAEHVYTTPDGPADLGLFPAGVSETPRFATVIFASHRLARTPTYQVLCTEVFGTSGTPEGVGQSTADLRKDRSCYQPEYSAQG